MHPGKLPLQLLEGPTTHEAQNIWDPSKLNLSDISAPQKWFFDNTIKWWVYQHVYLRNRSEPFGTVPEVLAMGPKWQKIAIFKNNMRLRVRQEQSRMDAKGSWDTREASTDKFLAWTSGAQESSENTRKRNYGCWHLALTLNFAHGICLLGMQPNPPLYSLKSRHHVTLSHQHYHCPPGSPMHCYVIVLIPLWLHHHIICLHAQQKLLLKLNYM